MTGDAEKERIALDHATRVWRDLGAILSAHVLGLADLGLIDDGAASGLIAAIDRVAAGDPPGGRLLEQLTIFDERLDTQTPPGLTGVSRVGRYAPEVIATLHRLRQRDDLLDLAERVQRLWRAAIELAAAHATTLMPVYAGGRPMQPSTVGHWLGGFIGPLGRASRRIQLHVETVNASPMGAGALAAAGFGIDRATFAERLGFTSVHGNTFDALAAVDAVLDGAAIVESLAAAADRLLAALAEWMRATPPGFSLAESWLTTGEMPHLQRSPRFDTLSPTARVALGEAARIRAIALHLPYEPDIVADDALLDAWTAADAASLAVLDGLSDLLSDGLTVNRAFLANRAAKDLMTIGDLADLLMIDEGIEPGAAFQIAELVAGKARETGVDASGVTVEMIDAAGLLTIGREIKVEFENISRYLAPRRFIERRTTAGGPAPDATRQFLDQERLKLGAEVRAIATLRRRIDEAADSHRARVDNAIARVAEG